jgi:hypothetical protein
MDQQELVGKIRQIHALAAEVLIDLGDSPKAAKRHAARSSGRPSSSSGSSISFDLNPLAFMKKHGRGMSGPQKATLLLARLTKGDSSRGIELSVLEKQWNRMTSITGGAFNSAYMNRAKANGWVDAPKHGVYIVTKSWREVLS